jgi:hypothetical protein
LAADVAIAQSLDLIVPEQYRDRQSEGFRRVMATGVGGLDRAATNIPVECADGFVRAPGRFIFLAGARDEVLGVITLYSAPAGSQQPIGPIQPLAEREVQ